MKETTCLNKIIAFSFVLMFAGVLFAAEKQKPKMKIMDNYIAVFDLETKGKVDKDVSYPLSESIRQELVKSGKYEVIDRGNMNKILGEQKFQLSGCVAGQCIVEVGQLLGVGKIIVGSISLLGQTYYSSLSVINVETGKIEEVSEDDCKCAVDDLIKSSKRLVKKLLGEKVTEASEQRTVPSEEQKQREATAELERNRLEKERLEKVAAEAKLKRQAEEKERRELLAQYGRFRMLGGVIEDFDLGLQWVPANGQSMNHYQAEEYAKNLNLAGDGWRLPTIAELQSLKDNLDPVFNVKDGYFGGHWVWSSELNGSSKAWLFVFNLGVKEGGFSREYSDDSGRVLAVRPRR